MTQAQDQRHATAPHGAFGGAWLGHRRLRPGIPTAVVSAWLGHSDVNLTVKRYGRWSSEAREQWDWIKKLGKPVDAVAKGPWLGVVEGGG